MDFKEWNSIEVTIEIDYDKCVGHGNCTEVCPIEVYELQDDKAVPVNIDQCIQCCACIEACSEDAIDHSACEK